MQKLETLVNALIPTVKAYKNAIVVMHHIKVYADHSRECPHCHKVLFLPPGELQPGVYACPACEKRVEVYGNKMQWSIKALVESWVD